jgi:hypothetical protein
MVGTSVIIGCWTSYLSMLIIGWTIVGNWFPIECGVCVGGTIGCSSTGYTYLGT